MYMSEQSIEDVTTARIKKKSALLPQTSLARVESLTMPLVQEIVISADVRCEDCQRRITDVISRMHAETESMVVNLTEKKVTVVCRYPAIVAPSRQITSSSKNPFARVSLLRMISCSSSR